MAPCTSLSMSPLTITSLQLPLQLFKQNMLHNNTAPNKHSGCMQRVSQVHINTSSAHKPANFTHRGVCDMIQAKQSLHCHQSTHQRPVYKTSTTAHMQWPCGMQAAIPPHMTSDMRRRGSAHGRACIWQHQALPPLEHAGSRWAKHIVH